MSIVFTVLIVLVSILLCLVVLAQDAKGGGLNESMGSFKQVAGVRASNEIEKITWGLAIALVVLCVFSTISINMSAGEGQEVGQSEVQQYEDENDDTDFQNNAPQALPPANTPTQTLPNSPESAE